VNIVFAHVGRFKSEECERLVENYLKLAGKFAHIEKVSLSEREGQDRALSKWLEKRGSRTYLTILDERGKSFTSRELAARVEKIRDGSHSEWVIAVGGAHGYGSELQSRAQLLWSLSPLTFPHDLAAAVAAEQIFRSLAILNKHPYHND
jgi:23S rRNA (pseudouridine1915-N3)-methyltransferase